MLLDLLLLPVFVWLIVLPVNKGFEAEFVLAEKETVRGRRIEDTLAVFAESFRKDVQRMRGHE